MGVEEIVGQLKKRFIIVAVILLVALGALWLLLSGARSLKDTLVRQNETRAQQTLATINQALKAYNEKYGGYPFHIRTGTRNGFRIGQRQGFPQPLLLVLVAHVHARRNLRYHDGPRAEALKQVSDSAVQTRQYGSDHHHNGGPNDNA